MSSLSHILEHFCMKEIFVFLFKVDNIDIIIHKPSRSYVQKSIYMPLLFRNHLRGNAVMPTGDILRITAHVHTSMCLNGMILPNINYQTSLI